MARETELIEDLPEQLAPQAAGRRGAVLSPSGAAADRLARRALPTPSTVAHSHSAIRPFSREVGAVWKNRNGDGFTLQIHEQLSVARQGRLRAAARAGRPSGEPAEQGQRKRTPSLIDFRTFG